jgi:DNA mismatch repair protein MSH4
MNTAADTKLLSIIRENLEVDRYGVEMQSIDRRYWSETSGHEYVQQLAFPDDLESLKVSMGGNYFAVCCFAAVGMATTEKVRVADGYRR